jgi:hypothetical protein
VRRPADLVGAFGRVAADFLRRILNVVERQYYWFGERIDTTPVKGRDTDEPTVRRIREATKAAVEQGIAFLRAAQKNDPNRSVIKRLLGPERR